MKVFRSFRLDAANHCLWRSNERVPLAPKAFDVLRYLVEHPGRLVTQDEILEAVWPETYVNPELIKKYILTIRKVLGDSPGKPTFIETIPKRGYQFVAPVSSESNIATPDSSGDVFEGIVGRRTALAQLDACLARALIGQRQVVFVTGEGGIGKTTLVDVFSRSSGRHANLRIARGHCVEGFGGKEAYYPIFEALGQLTRDAEGSPVAQILAKRAPTWLIQMPSLVKAEHKEALQREVLGATRERMVREICGALETMTAETPLLLVFEDLHWVDPSTLDVISALARRREAAKLALLATYRPVDVVLSQSPLKALKQDLQVHRLCEEVALEHLEQSDVSEYLDAQFGSGRSASGLAVFIHRHSGGNPLFMAAIVEEMIKEGLIVQDSGCWTLTRPLEDIVPRVPDTLQQMLEVQFDRLSAVEQRVLKSASVAGEHFSAWSISRSLDMEPAEVEGFCEGLTERQQFIKSAGIHDLTDQIVSAHYEFRHFLYWQAIYRRLPDAIRSKLHRSIGERLQSLCTPCTQDLVSQLALHFEEGRDYERAIEYLLRTAQNAEQRFAHRDSLQILQHALELAPRVSPDTRKRLEIHILERIGDAQSALGNMFDSARAYDLESIQAAEMGLAEIQVNALSRLARSAAFFDSDRGIAACEQAVQVSVGHDDPLLQARAQMLAASFRLLYNGWRKEDADLCARGNHTLRANSDSGLPEYHQIMYSHVQSLQGDYRDALNSAEAGFTKTIGAGSVMGYLAALSGKVVATIHLGRFGDVLHVVQHGQEMAEKNGNDPWFSIFRRLETWLRILTCDFEGALRITKVILGTTPEPLLQTPIVPALLFAGYAELGLGNHQESLRYFQKVRGEERPLNAFWDWYWRMNAQLGLSLVQLASGNTVEARHEADAFLTAALSTADPNMQALGWEMQAQVAIAEKELVEAERCIENAQTILQKVEIPCSAWRIHATAHHLFTRLKNEREAEKHRFQAETCVLALANSLPEDEPLRATFLAAEPVRRVLGLHHSSHAPGRNFSKATALNIRGKKN